MNNNQIGQLNPNYKYEECSKLHYCIDCNKQVSGYKAIGEKII